MIIKKYLLIFLFILPLQAANTDDEIIKNLDFFQNIELLKDDNPYITQSPPAEKEKTSEDLTGKEKIK
jgi:hypothetical protein